MRTSPPTFGTVPFGVAPYAAPEAASENILFLSPRLSDAATVTGSSEIGSLPARFTQNAEPTKVWRTAGLVEALVYDFGEPTVIDAAAIGAHTLGPDAACRLRLANTVPDLTGAPEADSGTVSAWPASGKHYDPNWPHEVSLVRLANAAAYRYARLDLVDPANPAGYFDVGRVAVGKAWQAATNIDIDPSIGFVPNDVQEPTPYGQIFTDPRPWAQRQFDLNFSGADQDDVHDYAMELSRLRGQAGDVFVFIDPGETTRFHRWSMQALFSGRAQYRAQPAWNGPNQVWTFPVTLIEKL